MVSKKNLSNQGSSKNQFLKEFFKEPIKVSQRILNNCSLRHHLWFHKEPFKPGFFKEPCPSRVLQRTNKRSSNEEKKGSSVGDGSW